MHTPPSDDQVRAERIMLRMGFPADADGPYVRELRAHVLRQCQQGMVDRSGGTWRHELEGGSPPKLEERARHTLALDWEVENGAAHLQRHLDGPIRGPRDVLNIVLDWLGARATKLRLLWRRRVLRRHNPYLTAEERRG